MQSISNQSILKSCSFINGSWLASSCQFAVINPATQKVLAEVSEVESSQIELAISGAHAALSVWQQKSESKRAECLIQWQQLIRDNIEDLARLMTLEQGKPLTEAKTEVLHSANYTKLYAELTAGLFASEVIESPNDQMATVVKRPIGVVSAITPWNFPCSMVIRKAAAAMAAGCTVVLKPSELTPLSALALAQLSLQAGIPAGVFNVVVGTNSQAIGEYLTQHPKIAKLSFTGSTKVGKKLLVQCANGVKRTSMELGGNAPFIVFADCDIEAAVEGAISSKFRNAGQTCVSANRFIVQQDCYEEFKNKIIEKTKLLSVGNGLTSSTGIGPLINQQAVDKMRSMVTIAIEQGAQKLYASEFTKTEGSFYPPTILTGVSPEMALFNQEIFGPVISISTFETESQALALANHSELGLCGYLFTQDQDRIDRLSNQLQVGMLGINQAKLSNPAAPFGGVKQSGMGREGGRYGIEEFLDYQYMCRPNTSSRQ